MSDPTRQIDQAATTASGLPVSPSLGPTLKRSHVQKQILLVDHRVILICVLSIALALIAGGVAQILLWLIALITNISFHHLFSFAPLPPVSRAFSHAPTWTVIFIPIIGGLIVGLMARFGSEGIRGHGIPEAMERVLLQESRIPPRLTFLKPLSAAIAIGTGGPFGAEGPIIATGGAMGSLIGQVLRTSAAERKTLLAAGAAAGMAATFGSPVSATLLAIELLLFEFRPRSFLPVALASAAAAGIRFAFHAPTPLFPMPPDIGQPTEIGLALYAVVGALVGFASVLVTHSVYAVEDGFGKLPIHWMWWPAIGAVAVGVIGYFAPRTLGVGYDNITDLISNNLPLSAMVGLCLLKFLSWTLSLGSGTSGGTLAPLFTFGSALGGIIGIGLAHFFPDHIDVRVAALVGMAAMFAGASRALLTSVVFAFETTLQPNGLLPILGGCAVAYLISSAFMRDTIMTAKVVRHGVLVPVELAAEPLEGITVSEIYSRDPITLPGDWTIAKAREWLGSNGPQTQHQGYPVLDTDKKLLGLLTRRDVLNSTTPPTSTLAEVIHRPPLTIFPHRSLGDATTVMVTQNVGRLAVVSPDDPRHLLGVITRSDVLSSYRRKLSELEISDSIMRRGRKRREQARAAAVASAPPPPTPAVIPDAPPKPHAIPESNPSTP